MTVSPPSPDIYSSLNYREWLAEWFRMRDGAPSMRGFAPSVPCSPQLVSAVVRGGRDLDPEHAPRWARALELDDEAAAFFCTLVQLLHGNSSRAREAALQRALATQQYQRAQRVSQATLRLFSSWLVPVLAELATCPGFSEQLDELHRALLPEVTEGQLRDALGTLTELGVLQGPAGQRRATGQQHWRTDHEVYGGVVAVALQTLHREMLRQAQGALDNLPGDERHFTTTTFALPSSAMPQLKQRISQFQEELMQLIASAEGPPDEVHQLGLQLFPLARLTAPDE